MAGGFALLHFLLALVGNGVAHGVEDNGFVFGVRAAGQQIHGLHHMGVAADDDVYAHVAELLSHGSLVGVGALTGLPFVFFAPVKVDDRGLGPGGFHFLQITAHLGIEGGEIVIGKIVADPGLADFCIVVEPRGALGAQACGIGVAEHTYLDAVDLFNGPFLLVGGEIGAQGFLTRGPDNLQGALEAYQGGVIAVVVGGE